jgi:hypothetical protein
MQAAAQAIREAELSLPRLSGARFRACSISAAFPACRRTLDSVLHHDWQARGLAQLFLRIVLTMVSIELASDGCDVLSKGFAYSWFLKRESAILTSPTAKLQVFFPD